MRYIREIIGAETRCSNHSLLSFGVCVSDPLLKWGDTIREAKRAFAGDLIHIAEFGKDKVSLKIWMDEHPEGHYILYSQGHALAVHDSYLVDTSLRGVGRTIVLDAYQVINNDRRIERAFEEYMKQYPDRVFRNTAPPRKRRPKREVDPMKVRNKGIPDLVSSLKRQGFVDVYHDELLDMAVANNIGKKVRGDVKLSYDDMDELQDLWLKTSSN